jgi:hypothetical protein
VAQQDHDEHGDADGDERARGGGQLQSWSEGVTGRRDELRADRSG